MGRSPISNEHIISLNEAMIKYPKGKKEDWHFYALRICSKANVGKNYHERTLQAIRHVNGDPEEYRNYTARRSHRTVNVDAAGIKADVQVTWEDIEQQQGVIDAIDERREPDKEDYTFEICQRLDAMLPAITRIANALGDFAQLLGYIRGEAVE